MARKAIALVSALCLALVPALASAARPGGGGGGARAGGGGGGGGGMNRGGGGASMSRASAPKSINRPGGGGYNNNRPGGGGNGNRPGNNRPGGNTNINNSHDTNINVVGNNHGNGYHGGGGCCYNNHYDVWDAVGTAAAITATVAVTSAIVGSMTTTRPPDCVQTSYGNTTYLQCGSSWYQPNMVGGNVQYVVVGRPY